MLTSAIPRGQGRRVDFRFLHRVAPLLGGVLGVDSHSTSPANAPTASPTHDERVDRSEQPAAVATPTASMYPAIAPTSAMKSWTPLTSDAPHPMITPPNFTAAVTASPT